MSTKARARRARAAAAGSPALRRAAGRVLRRFAPPGARANGSSWSIKEGPLRAVVNRYRGAFPLPPVSYGTARDLADSFDHMPGVAGASFDMKDLQRCWTMKAVLGNVPPGGRLLEIGAGEPLIAGALSRAGYEVTVVDPYDGSGNGPKEFEIFRTAYPDLTFVREQFPPSEPLGDDFAAVYSISVLEHVRLEALDRVMAGARELLTRNGGVQIHTVDHVLAGWGAEEHLAKLRRVAAGMSVSDDELHAALAGAVDDPETYFVSAESHNRWRGEIPYDQYPMRRIVSVNLFSGAGTDQ
ncbi:MAG TPA: methyltransferase domain-containing protein [Solirubrobacterales bacterium]|nr:methyltransferase domain-containing protein [Solirubrobacterales bacterium]